MHETPGSQTDDSDAVREVLPLTWPILPISESRANFHEFGLLLVRTLPMSCFPDGVLAMVLDYIGPRRLFVLYWCQHDDHDEYDAGVVNGSLPSNSRRVPMCVFDV